MSFDLTSDQRDFRDMMRAFVDDKVAPNAARYDRDQEFPWDSYKACAALELCALEFPKSSAGPVRTW